MSKIFYDRFDRPHVLPEDRTVSERISLNGILVDDGKVLLIKPQYLDVWELPGGGKEDGESEAEALIREVLEGANYLVTGIGECTMIKRKLLYADDFDEYYDATQKFHLITSFQANEVKTLSFETMEIKWFPLEKATRTIRENERDVMEAFLKSLRRCKKAGA